MPRLLSVNVGLPRDISWRGETVHTAIWKQPVQGRRSVRRLNIDGDGQGDLAGHGGEHRAVMVYQRESYHYWETHLGRNDFTFGQFGENFTVEGMGDDEVCIGDRYRIGTALFEVTQPRVTCYRLGIRMNEPEMAALVVAHHRPGFYLRVLAEGETGAGDEIVKVLEQPERMTVAEIDALLYLPGRGPEQLQRALKIPALSEGWKGSFRDLSESASSGPYVTPGSAERPAWPGFRRLLVAGVERETPLISSFTLAATTGERLPPSLPGQSLVVKLPVVPDAPPVLRNYSLSGDPAADRYRISVKREQNGAASTFLHERVRAGDALEVSAPRGDFLLRPGTRPVVLSSVGVGATPVMAMLHALAASADRREVWWLFGARNGSNHPFRNESRQLVRSLPKGTFHVVYSQPDSDDHPDSIGHLDPPLLDRLGIPNDADFYLCGPGPFLSAMRLGIAERGTPVSQIYSEVFGTLPSLTPGITPVNVPRSPHMPEPQVAGTGPLVSFTRSGLTVPWSSHFRNLLELAEACDVPVKWSCRTGVCHTCECALIGGSVEYAPQPLDPPTDDRVLICCSQPREPLALDL